MSNLLLIGRCDGRAHVIEFTADVLNALNEAEGVNRVVDKDVAMRDPKPIAAQGAGAPVMQEATQLNTPLTPVEPLSSPLTSPPPTQELDLDAMDLDPPNAVDNEAAPFDDDRLYLFLGCYLSRLTYRFKDVASTKRAPVSSPGKHAS